MANEVEEGGKLSHLFDEIWAMHEKLENSTEPSNSDTVQVSAVSLFRCSVLFSVHTDGNVQCQTAIFRPQR